MLWLVDGYGNCLWQPGFIEWLHAAPVSSYLAEHGKHAITGQNRTGIGPMLAASVQSWPNSDPWSVRLLHWCPMKSMASWLTSDSIVCSTDCSGGHKKDQCSALLGLYELNPPETDGSRSQRACHAGRISMTSCHHGNMPIIHQSWGN